MALCFGNEMHDSTRRGRMKHKKYLMDSNENLAEKTKISIVCNLKRTMKQKKNLKTP